MEGEDDLDIEDEEGLEDEDEMDLEDEEEEEGPLERFKKRFQKKPDLF